VIVIGSIDVTAQAFQALWYFTLLLICMGIALLVASGYIVAASVRLWRNGERPSAVILTTVTSVTCLIFVGFAVAAMVGLAQGGSS
jgi:heme/copper-type cytochrome/quinol oxidase subunit 3